MAKKKNRTREFRVDVYCNIDELSAIEENMERAGITNRELYARKLLTDGYIINCNEPLADLKEISRLVRMASHNINQVAKRANETQSVHSFDLKELQEEVQKIAGLVQEANSKVTKTLDF